MRLRLFFALPLLILMGACAQGPQVAVVAPEAPAAIELAPVPPAPPVPPELPPASPFEEVEEGDEMPEAIFAAPEPRYVVHLSKDAVEDNRDFYERELSECFAKYHGLTEVGVVYDLTRDLAPEEIETYELEGFGNLDTGCAKNLFTLPDGGVEYEE